jgi:hypothetical protein
MNNSHSKKAILWWALTSRKGRIYQSTIRATKRECWEHGFSMVSNEQPPEWLRDNWKRWDASMKSAQKLGYRFIRVKIIPVAH